jgi:hypothetical protein
MYVERGVPAGGAGGAPSVVSAVERASIALAIDSVKAARAAARAAWRLPEPLEALMAAQYSWRATSTVARKVLLMTFYCAR